MTVYEGTFNIEARTDDGDLACVIVSFTVRGRSAEGVAEVLAHIGNYVDEGDVIEVLGFQEQEEEEPASVQPVSSGDDAAYSAKRAITIGGRTIYLPDAFPKELRQEKAKEEEEPEVKQAGLPT